MFSSRALAHSAGAMRRTLAVTQKPAAATALSKLQANSRQCTTTAPEVTTAGRWPYTLEVMVSKIFPAGFGWQFSSGIADGAGFAADSAGFAVITGCGDATGVFLGHSLYKAAQSAVAPGMKVDLTGEVQTATWLATAAFFCGTAWQPIVNTLHDGMKLSFTPTFLGTFAGCGAVFYAGLRAGRALYPFMNGCTAQNNAQDIGLGLSIGGATATFVATDTTFHGADSDALYKVLAPVFNIADDASTIVGCVTAGGSTFTGYGVINSVQNIALPAGMNWQDANNCYC